MIKCMTDLKRKEMFMADQKIDNLLNLAMDATPEERRKSTSEAAFGKSKTTQLPKSMVKKGVVMVEGKGKGTK